MLRIKLSTRLEGVKPLVAWTWNEVPALPAIGSTLSVHRHVQHDFEVMSVEPRDEYPEHFLVTLSDIYVETAEELDELCRQFAEAGWFTEAPKD